jgi:hypothetical protein
MTKVATPVELKQHRRINDLRSCTYLKGGIEFVWGSLEAPAP